MTTVGYVCGFIGAGLTLASYTMKSMLPLRLVALAASVSMVFMGFCPPSCYFDGNRGEERMRRC